MAKAGNLLVALMLDSARYVAGLSQVTKGTNRTVQAIQKQLRGLVTFAIGAGGLYAIVRGFKAVSEAAGLQEEAIERLTQSMKNSTNYTAANLKALSDQAAALQKVTRYEDNNIQVAQAQLMALGRLRTEGVLKLTPSLLNFATVMRMDVITAAELFGKTLDGSRNMLARYGYALDMTKDATGRLDDIVRISNEKFKDISKIKGYTTSLIQMKNAMGDLSEEIGFFVTGKQGGVFGAMASGWGAVADNMKRAREEAVLLKSGAALGVPEVPEIFTVGMWETAAGGQQFKDKKALIAIEFAQMRADYKRIREDIEVARRNMQRSGEMDPARQQRLGYNIAAEEEYKKRIKDEEAAEKKRLKDAKAAAEKRVKIHEDALAAMQEAREKYHVEPEVYEWFALKDAQKAAHEKAEIMRPLYEKYHVEEDVMEWGKLQEEQKKKALFRKKELDIARDNFNDYAWAVSDTWAYHLDKMSRHSLKYSNDFNRLILLPMMSVASGRLSNYLVDELFGWAEGPSKWNPINWGGRTADLGGSEDYSAPWSSKKAAMNGVTIHLSTNLSDDQVVSALQRSVGNNAPGMR